MVNAVPQVDLQLLDDRDTVAGRPVSLQAIASDDDGPTNTIRILWDLDGDGTYERDGGTQEDGSVTAETTFATSGTRFVGVRAIDGDGGEGDALMRVDVAENRPPQVSLVPDAERVRVGRELGFLVRGVDPDGGPGDTVKLAWDEEGDGTFGPAETVALPVLRSIAFPAAGRRTVRVRVSDEATTVTVEATVDVMANVPPEASLRATPESPAVGDQLFLDAALSEDQDGEVAAYRWDLDGDGTYQTDGGDSPELSLTPEAAGVRRVGVQVTDNDGATGTATRDVTVRPDGGGGGTPGNVEPLATLIASPATPVTGGSVLLDASASSDPDGFITRYEWDLDGDGAFERDGGDEPTIVVPTPVAGTRTFRVRVTDDGGATAVANRTLTVANDSGGGGGGGAGPGATTTIELAKRDAPEGPHGDREGHHHGAGRDWQAGAAPAQGGQDVQPQAQRPARPAELRRCRRCGGEGAPEAEQGGGARGQRQAQAENEGEGDPAYRDRHGHADLHRDDQACEAEGESMSGRRLRRLRRLGLGAACALLAAAPAAWGGAGDRDESFGTHGSVQLGSEAVAWDVAPAPDGGALIAAQAPDQTGQPSFAVERLTANGAFDAGFGRGGIVTTSFADTTRGYAQRIAAVGTKIVAMGEASPNAGGAVPLLLARYGANGSLDSTFGTGGRAQAALPGLEPYSSRRGLAVLSGGGFLVSLSAYRPADQRNVIAVAKLTSAGALDASFGSGGVAAVPGFGGGDVAIDASGRPLVTGSFDLPGETRYGVARFTAAGVPDETFGPGGVVTPTLPVHRPRAGRPRRPGDTVLVAGGADRPEDSADGVLLLRLTAGGDLDPAFGGGDGYTVAPWGFAPAGNEVLVRPDGRVLVHACEQFGGETQLLGFDAAGTADATWGLDGRALGVRTGGSVCPGSAALQPDGRTLTAAYSQVARLRNTVNGLPTVSISAPADPARQHARSRSRRPPPTPTGACCRSYGTWMATARSTTEAARA